MTEAKQRRKRALKLTSDARSALLGHLEAGLPIETAARLVGVPPLTVGRWRALSREGRRGYAGFEDEVLAALAAGEATHIRRIAEADDWRAAAWLLTRMYPERWAEAALKAPDAPPPPNDLTGL